MALSREVIYTTTGTTASVNLDPSIAPFNANVGVTLTAGTTSYKLQYSLSGPDVSDANSLWFDSTDFPAATVASKSAPINAPVQKVRLVIATLSGGNLVLQILQGFTIN